MRKYIGIFVTITAIGISITASKAVELNFSDINTSGIESKFSEIHFNAGGNDFGGGIFWLGTKTLNQSSQQNIDFGDINDPDNFKGTIKCNRQLKGLYYNPQRGERVLPLDSETLTQLQQRNGSYNSLSLVGGLFTSCSGDTYRKISPYSIFGQITYTESGESSNIFAGLRPVRTTNNVDPTPKNSFQLFNNTIPLGFIADDKGGLGTVGGIQGKDSLANCFTEEAGPVPSDNEALQEFMIQREREQYFCSIFSMSGGQVLENGSSLQSNENAANIIWNLIIQGTLGLSNTIDPMEITAILGNPRGNSTIISSKTINNADIINKARRNAEELCKGKTIHRIGGNTYLSSLSTNNESTICIQGENRRRLTIDLAADEALYANKTLIIKDVHVVLKNSMTETTAPLDLLVDRGQLMIQTSTPSAYTNFNSQGFPDAINPTNAGVFLKGNIIVNGLLRGGYIQYTYPHKLHILGKLATLNTPTVASTKREEQITDLFTLPARSLPANLTGMINLQDIFIWKCYLSGSSSDNTICGNGGDISRVPLVITDATFSSRLLK